MAAGSPLRVASAAPHQVHLVAGVNHRTAGARLRDQLFVAPDDMPPALAGLRSAGLDQALIVSTCDRTEIWCATGDPAEARRSIEAFLGDRSGPAEELAAGFYLHTGIDAARHAMAVAASLESQVLGEPQILGQIKAAHRIASDAGMAGAGIEALLDATYATAKRVRRETRVAERPVTIAAAAIRVARDVHGPLDGCRVMLIGDGDMGEALVRQFVAAGIADVTVTAENPARAEALAAVLDCHLLDWQALDDGLVRADIVVSATTGRALVLTEERARTAHRRRRRRPVFAIDAAVPGDIDRAVDAIDGVFRFDLADLEQVAYDGHRERHGEADRARAIVEEEAARFARDRQARDAAGGITALRDHFEAERQAVLKTVGAAGADEATRLLVNRLLHAPSTALRELSGDPDQRAAAEALLSRLFGTGVAPAGKTPKEPGS
ncbi:MAG: glutamyl-tRNA reductase [Bauldia litoralis]